PCSGVVLLGVVDALNGSDRSLEFVGDGGPFYFLSNNFYFGDSLTVSKGAHGLKFGGDLRVRQNTQFDGGRTGGTKGNVVYGSSSGGFASFNYTGIGPADSGSSMANLLLGYSPGSVTRGNPGGPYLLSNKEIDFYVQDDWKVNPNLTLNLGLRYDVFTPPTERYDQQSNFDPATRNLIRAGSGNPLGRTLIHTDKNNFGPRIGFSYSGLMNDRKLVLRGGYGLLYATDTSGQLPLTANPPSGASYSCNLANYGTASCPQLPARFNFDTGYLYPVPPAAPASVFPAPSGQNIFFINPNLAAEMYHEFNLTAQWEFRPNWLGEVAYVGSRGRNLLTIRNIGNGTRGSRQITSIDTITTTDSNGESKYDALQAKLEKRFSKGLSILSTYTWSHAIDNSPGGFCIGGTGPATCGPANPLRPELDRGNSDLDVTHRFIFSNVYELPIGRGKLLGSGMSKSADVIVGGWQLNNVVTIQSGPVYSVTNGSERADLVGDPFANLAAGREINRAAFRAAVTPIFSGAPTGPKFGTLGRNTFRGQRQEYWDASLFKNFRVTKISETLAVQLRFQAYNVLNHINHSVPSHDLGDTSFFGIDRTVQQSRLLEWALKILF
ncbi:MAG TPA: TonB-dependent receptor, partial [Pyrinomonadaceae bacterium]|nr:TonB-dependent receptor [Pyrinomonadaceae bacterium]